MGPQGYLSTLHALGINTHFRGWVVDLICKCTYLPLSGPLLNRSAKEANKQTKMPEMVYGRRQP